jgi:hypothetical protein
MNSTLNKTAKVTDRPTKLGKNKAVEMLNNINGRIFSCTFTKKDGTEGKVTGQKVKTSKPTTAMGYLKVYDMVKHGTRTVNLQTLKTLKINGKTYTVNK